MDGLPEERLQRGREFNYMPSQRRKRGGEDGGGVGGGGGEQMMKKKSKIEWTPAEDAILAESVEKNWKGSWCALQESTGLPHSSKACRLRWVNHHRPDLSTAEFTAEEEARVLSLIDQLGLKWTDIATNFPGRTNSDVKNLWYRALRPRLCTGRAQVVVQNNQPPTPPSLPPSVGDYDLVPRPEYPPAFPVNSFADSGVVLGLPAVPLAISPPPAWSSLPLLGQPPAALQFAKNPEAIGTSLYSPSTFSPSLPTSTYLSQSPAAWNSAPGLPASYKSTPSVVGGGDEVIGNGSKLYPLSAFSLPLPTSTHDLPQPPSAWNALPELNQPPASLDLGENPKLPSYESTTSLAVEGDDEVIDDGSWLHYLSAFSPQLPNSMHQPELTGSDVLDGGGVTGSSGMLVTDDVFDIGHGSTSSFSLPLPTSTHHLPQPLAVGGDDEVISGLYSLSALSPQLPNSTHQPPESGLFGANVELAVSDMLDGREVTGSSGMLVTDDVFDIEEYAPLSPPCD